MGMIRLVAFCGIEVGWWGQKEWRELMEKLQYKSLRRCTGAAWGARREMVRKVAFVEDVVKFMKASYSSFLVRTMCASVHSRVTEDYCSLAEGGR